jgi:Kef-type K+ transport system membrane component KefB
VHNLFFELTIVLILAGTVAFVISLLKQPSIIAYILSGIILGSFGYYRLHMGETLQGMSQIGITLLLFMVGLELDVTQLKKIGKTALLTGAGQIVFTSVIGFAILRALGFSYESSLFLAPALTFASTIIIVKLLTEKKDLQSLYGRIVVGVFLMQDFVAVLILLALAGVSSQGSTLYSGLPAWQGIMFTLVRALILILFVAWMSAKVFPKIVNIIGRSEELLLIFSLAWALGLAAFVSLPIVGFSLEIGGFLAGLALARTAVHYEISARIKPLRDFFIIIFFIVLGAGLGFADFGTMLIPAIVLAIFVLLGNPIIVMVLLALQGYKPRTGFFAGVTVAQISEFSLILVALGSKLGILSQPQVSMMTFVGIITFAASSYMVMNSGRLYEWLRPVLRHLDFFKGSAEKHMDMTVLKNHVVIVGGHRMGRHLISALNKQKQPFVIVDFNPEVVEKYLEENYKAVCGDITDTYIQDQVNLQDAKLIISTVPDLNDNIALLDAVKRISAGKKHRPKLIFIAQDEDEIKYLYEQNIDYVISPHFMSGLHLAKILEDDHSFRGLKKLKESHIKMIG